MGMNEGRYLQQALLDNNKAGVRNVIAVTGQEVFDRSGVIGEFGADILGPERLENL